MTGLLTPLQVPVDLGRDEARARALAELAKAKYGGTPAWVDRTAGRFTDLVERLTAWVAQLLFGRASAGSGVHWGFVIVVVALLVALALVVWRVGLPRWSRRRRAASLGLDPAQAPTDYRSLAEHAAERGDWAVAVRERFRAAVRELEVRTILDVRPARTAWEAAWAASKALPGCRDALHAAAATFNAVVYGDRPGSETEYAQLVTLDGQLRDAADAGSVDQPLSDPAVLR